MPQKQHEACLAVAQTSASITSSIMPASAMSTRSTELLEGLQGSPTCPVQLFLLLLPGLLELWLIGGMACCPRCLMEALGTNSLFRLPRPTPAGGVMNRPCAWGPLGSSALVIFFTLCLGVPVGEAEGTDS